jgi:hypothetical protein
MSNKAKGDTVASPLKSQGLFSWLGEVFTTTFGTGTTYGKLVCYSFIPPIMRIYIFLYIHNTVDILLWKASWLVCGDDWNDYFIALNF